MTPYQTAGAAVASRAASEASTARTGSHEDAGADRGHAEVISGSTRCTCTARTACTAMTNQSRSSTGPTGLPRSPRPAPAAVTPQQATRRTVLPAPRCPISTVSD